MTATPTTPAPSTKRDSSPHTPVGVTDREYRSSEYAAYQILRLAAEHPGTCGRIRMARIIGNYSVPHRSDADADAEQFADYASDLDWPLRELTRLIDSLAEGGLLTQSVGPGPVVCITRAGCRALEALTADQRTTAPTPSCWVGRRSWGHSPP